MFSHKPSKTEETFSPVCFEMAAWQAACASASDAAVSAVGTAAGGTGCCWPAGTAARWLETAAAAGDSEGETAALVLLSGVTSSEQLTRRQSETTVWCC